MAWLPSAAQACTAASKGHSAAQAQCTDEGHMLAALEGSRWPMGASVQGRPGLCDRPGRCRCASALCCCALSDHCCSPAVPYCLPLWPRLCLSGLFLSWPCAGLSLACLCSVPALQPACLHASFISHPANLHVQESHNLSVHAIALPQPLLLCTPAGRLSDQAPNLLLLCSGAGACASCEWGCDRNHNECKAWQ